MRKPLVSIITPTRGRERLLPLIYSCFDKQDWPNLEWLVDDDSPEASVFLNSLSDTRIKYYHTCCPRSVGMKRNDLVKRSSGDYIVHFDDDDYYASGYISHVLSLMVDTNADCLKLSGLFIYDRSSKQLFYWDQTQSAGMCFVGPSYFHYLHAAVTRHNNEGLMQMLLGYGFGYAYRRSVWNRIKFPDANFGEDHFFMAKAANTYSIILLPDTLGLCLHVLHSANMSGCFPQYIIPPFMVSTLFPQAAAYFLEND